MTTTKERLEAAKAAMSAAGFKGCYFPSPEHILEKLITALEDLQRAEDELIDATELTVRQAKVILEQEKRLAQYESGTHVMVPREVSEEMLADILTESDLRWQANAERYYKVLWAKMIEAAQQQEKE